MKGKRTLRNLTLAVAPDLFPEENKTTTAATPYERKVELLIARYVYFILEKKYATTDQLLEQLAFEFCISTYQVTQIIDKNIAKATEMRKDPPKKEWYKINWAHIVW